MLCDAPLKAFPLEAARRVIRIQALPLICMTVEAAVMRRLWIAEIGEIAPHLAWVGDEATTKTSVFGGMR
jgi:hypothetical protein